MRVVTRLLSETEKPPSSLNSSTPPPLTFMIQMNSYSTINLVFKSNFLFLKVSNTQITKTGRINNLMINGKLNISKSV